MGERDGDRRDTRDTGGAATPDLESHLGTALRVYDPDPEAERRALAAFRTAHASGRTPRTRPRDDWRPAPTRAAPRWHVGKTDPGNPTSPRWQTALHPPRVVQDGLRVGDADALEEHDQVVVAVGGAEDLDRPRLCTVALRSTERKGRCDRSTAHVPGLSRPTERGSQPETIREYRRVTTGRSFTKDEFGLAMRLDIVALRRDLLGSRVKGRRP